MGNIGWGGMKTYEYRVWENEEGPGFYYTIEINYGATYDEPDYAESIYIDETIYETAEEAEAAGKAKYTAEYEQDNYY